MKATATNLLEQNLGIYQQELKYQRDVQAQQDQYNQQIALKQMDYLQEQNTPKFETI
jgi:hypothetical protein